MKRLFLSLLIFVSLISYSQNSLWIEKGKHDPLVVFEFSQDKTDNINNYIYVESELSHNITNSTYILASRDQKWWNKPIWIHGEFRTFVGQDILSNNIYMIGPMFQIVNGSLGFFNIQTLYRYDGKNNYQVTLLSDIEYKRLYFSAYIDNYGVDEFHFHNENRIFFKINNSIRIGCNLVLNLNEEEKGLYFNPMGVLRIDL